mmetsp:Transcript_4146/g.5537  ORF Transcript_4146/g.5537 Transcript_4146/m.5537 type:complete len:213 (+) Transcript_4146:334-972(+)
MRPPRFLDEGFAEPDGPCPTPVVRKPLERFTQANRISTKATPSLLMSSFLATDPARTGSLSRPLFPADAASLAALRKGIAVLSSFDPSLAAYPKFDKPALIISISPSLLRSPLVTIIVLLSMPPCASPSWCVFSRALTAPLATLRKIFRIFCVPSWRSEISKASERPSRSKSFNRVTVQTEISSSLPASTVCVTKAPSTAAKFSGSEFVAAG